MCHMLSQTIWCVSLTTICFAQLHRCRTPPQYANIGQDVGICAKQGSCDDSCYVLQWLRHFVMSCLCSLCRASTCTAFYICDSCRSGRSFVGYAASKRNIACTDAVHACCMLYRVVRGKTTVNQVCPWHGWLGSIIPAIMVM